MRHKNLIIKYYYKKTLKVLLFPCYASCMHTYTFSNPFPRVFIVTENVNQLGDKNKNLQHNHNVQTDCGIAQTHNIQQTVYFTPNGPKTLLPIDLVRANNTAPLQQTDKIGSKMPLQLPVAQQQHTHGHGPRKTVIQVNTFPLLLYTRTYLTYNICTYLTYLAIWCTFSATLVIARHQSSPCQLFFFSFIFLLQIREQFSQHNNI